MSYHRHLRIALLSDTHGVLDGRVAAVIEGSDWIVHAGDIGNAEVLHQLARLGDKLVAVRGNNDTPSHWPQQDHAILTALPHERSIALPGGELLVLHGHRINPAAQRHSRLRERYPAARAVVYGHSHRLVEDIEQGPWVLNPGAAGRARTHGGPSCLILQVKAGQWHVEHHRFVPKSVTTRSTRKR
ncbi:MAG: metallophosphatase family protein [Gammaproteobacteria bacterium]|nr:metallophosphatase family protein [Gammaproteobacteria bacterium]MCW8957788.1 metallophosphatase family protein [Gammaproteobacteria bacterium]MCW8972091.1 metallophosphatase family protein [Gammaproteobacteria bacterium]MCW8993604.1 metallophosphatase family protein [Gammaproteobacteria bacterium]